MSRRRLASFSSMWGTATGGIDVFNRDLIRALASLKEGPEICACLQVHGETLARDSTKYGFTAVTPGDNRSQPDAEFLEGWTLQQTQAVVLQMKLRYHFTPDIILLHDIFCKEALEVVREFFPDALAVTFFHSAYGRSEKKKHKPDSELERKARFQAEMIRDSDLSLSVGEFAESYLRSLVIDEVQSIGHVVPGRPQISPIRTKATHFNAISFGRLDPISDSIKQIRLSAKAWSEARKSEHLTGLKTSDVHFFAVGARGPQELLSIEKKAVEETWKAGILELPFEEVGDFDRSKLKAQMARCAFVLLNSWYENFGLTFLEACTAGVPTILSESSGFFHELKRILGEEEARRLTITTETDNRSEQEIVDDLKMKLIVGAQTYENVHKNAQELSSQIIRRWPSWEETARNLMLQVEGVRKALGKARVPDRPRRTAIDPQAQEEPTSETLDDLWGWCWQKNSPYFQRLLNESNIVSELRRPLTPLQKKFWDEREQLVSHNFKDLVLSGGTSSGKTTLAELLFGLSRPNEFARARILYIAPTKALAQERAASWSRRYPSPNLKEPGHSPVIVSTGDDNAQDGALIRGEFNIAATVYEKANVILSASQKLFEKINLVIVDEFHMIEDLHRGSILECLLAKLQVEKARRIDSVDRDNHLRLVAITTEEPGDALRNFLTFRDYDLAADIEPLVISDATRPRPVTHFCIAPGRTAAETTPIFEIKTFGYSSPMRFDAAEAKEMAKRFEKFRSTLTQLPDDRGFDSKRVRREYQKQFVEEWFGKNLRGRRLLVFMSSKYEILEFGRFVKNAIISRFSIDVEKQQSLSPNESGIESALKAISEIESTDFTGDLRRCAEEGVFIHNADVAQRVRAAFEAYFAQSLPEDCRSELIFSTETLSYGVNLQVTDVAFFNVLFPENERIPSGIPKSILLSRCAFANMSGRAGRLGQADMSRSAHVYWYLDPEEEGSFERVLEIFYVRSPGVSSRLFYSSDARVLDSFGKLERQSRILQEDGTSRSSNSGISNKAVEEFSYPFTRSVLDGLRFLGGTEGSTGFRKRIGCSEDDVITDFFFSTLYYSENCGESREQGVLGVESRASKKEKELVRAVRQVIYSGTDESYNLVRIPATGGYQITPLGCSTIDTGTEIATVTKLRGSLLALRSQWSGVSDGALPFEIAVLPVFFQPEVHRQYIGRLPEFRHAMDWNGLENRSDLISRALNLLSSMNVLRPSDRAGAQKVLAGFMAWTVGNQPIQSEPGRYEEAAHDSCLRLFVAFLAWISGMSLRNVIGEIQRLYSSSGGSTGASVFNFESFAENLTWKILFLISLLRASGEQILPSSSTFGSVRFVHRCRFGCTEQAIPLLYKNKGSSPPLNRVQAHGLLSEGLTCADVALGRFGASANLAKLNERRIRQHVRHFVRESFQELSRQFCYLASGTGLGKVNEDVSKEYWEFALRQVDALLGTAKPVPASWRESDPGHVQTLIKSIELEEERGQLLIWKSENGIELETYSIGFEDEESERIKMGIGCHCSASFSFGEFMEGETNSDAEAEDNRIVIDFPWAAGVAPDDHIADCRLSPAAFGILLSLCARNFVIDSERYILSIVAAAGTSPIGTRELFALSEPHLRIGGFPASLFEAWAKYIEVREF